MASATHMHSARLWGSGLAAAGALAFGWTATLAQATPFVYVTNQQGATVSQYQVGTAGLLFALTPPTVAAGNPNGIAVSPDGTSAYVVSRGGNAVLQYDVDPASGALSPKDPASVAAGGGPLRIAVTPDGKSAYVTNGTTDADTVSQYDIDPVSGALSPKIPATVPTGNAPTGVTVTPDGKSAYVANPGSDNISQYDIDPASGALSPKNPATVGALGGGPIGVAVTPDGGSAYVANVAPPGITQYDIDPVSGALSSKDPPWVDNGNSPSLGATHGAVTPDGRSAYFTNSDGGFGHYISQYDIDPASGALSPKDPVTVTAGIGPAGIALTPDGKSAYVTNFNSNSISQYDIGSDGALSPKTPPTKAAGNSPIEVAVNPAPGPPYGEASAGTYSLKKTQKQKGEKIIVKVKVKAYEDLEAKATGKIKVKKKSYKLKSVTKSVSRGNSKNLKLKPKKSKHAKKIAKALKRGKKAKAKLEVKLTDEAGNKKTTKLSVKLKRQ